MSNSSFHEDGFLIAQLEQKIKDLLAPINPSLTDRVIDVEISIEKELMSLLISPLCGREKVVEIVRLRKSLIEARAEQALKGEVI